MDYLAEQITLGYACVHAAVQRPFEYPLGDKETQYRVHGGLRGLLPYMLGVGREQRVGLAAPNLPVVVERRGVVGLGYPDQAVGQAEVRQRIVGFAFSAPSP